jgi:hypothetical protein
MKTKIYALRDDHWICYVGKTIKSLECRLASHLKDARIGNMSHKCNGIRKMLQEGRLPRITLIEVAEGNGSKEEIAWIAYFRSLGIDLWNQTDGGDGVNDSTVEVAKKISKTRVGMIFSDAHRDALRISHLGIKPSPLAAINSALATKGKHRPLHVRQAVSRAQKGKPRSPAYRAKIRASVKAMWAKRKQVAA